MTPILEAVSGPGVPSPIGPYSPAVRAGDFLFAQFFPSEPPARMTMQVPLPRGLLISIGCVALVES